MQFTKSEANAWIVASICIALTLGFDDGQSTFTFSSWISNYIFILLCIAGLLFLWMWITKKYAELQGCDAKISLWGIGTWNVKHTGQPKNKIYVGALIPLFFAIGSKGKIPFGVGLQYDLGIAHKEKRFGRKYQFIENAEEAKVAAIGPLIFLLIGILSSSWENIVGQTIMKGALAISITSLLPLPNLNGIKLFFNAPLTYVVYATFAAAIIVFLQVLSPLFLFLVAGIIAVGTGLYKYNKDL